MPGQSLVSCAVSQIIWVTRVPIGRGRTGQGWVIEKQKSKKRLSEAFSEYDTRHPELSYQMFREIAVQCVSYRQETRMLSPVAVAAIR
ncbi:uncharacterized protein SPSK_03790 [Sporothrix schenckii 1099-18]|uniref:Uncharacterized protein n=1 Tax=Sporothrix schenckii 1099-18 TaxID=1397361 RepID=A0A0F2LZ28_SPOSC|nr:uncharacterized protein SPSK_03790 [Sporothrix schenckii 1099-18]KJR82084.1 hypothetical protein SPSK_03790 [Sporothrix schenckii 1099-18]